MCMHVGKRSSYLGGYFEQLKPAVISNNTHECVAIQLTELVNCPSPMLWLASLDSEKDMHSVHCKNKTVSLTQLRLPELH